MARNELPTSTFSRFLLVSLFLHGLFTSAVLWWLPQFSPQQAEPPAVIMVNLAAAPRQRGTVAPLLAKKSAAAVVTPVRAAPVKSTETAPQTVTTTTPDSLPTTAPKKRAETFSAAAPAPTAPAQEGGNTVGRQQSEESAAVRQTTPATGHTGTMERAAPREMAFGSASGPGFRRQIQPVYPTPARRRGKEGTVLLRLSISETGQLMQVEVLEDPGHGLAEAALEAVRASSFTPARHNGRPVAVKATLPIRFTLQ